MYFLMLTFIPFIKRMSSRTKMQCPIDSNIFLIIHFSFIIAFPKNVQEDFSISAPVYQEYYDATAIRPYGINPRYIKHSNYYKDYLNY